ncbi:MAG TPA: TIGR04086 family membrane protein [Mobilitalea sp.]|nr:TIGR04086 family membrane protein [Mobilitalea sp.]
MDKILNQNTKILSLFKGLVISYIITAFILLLLSFLMLKLDLPGAVVSGGINFAYIISAFTGGFFVGKKLEQRKFLWGLIMGICYFLILMLVCLMMNSTSALPLGGLFTVFIICSLSGMLGGMIS